MGGGQELDVPNDRVVVAPATSFGPLLAELHTTVDCEPPAGDRLHVPDATLEHDSLTVFISDTHVVTLVVGVLVVLHAAVQSPAPS